MSTATTISLLNFKGGVGKTTLAVNLAAGLANSTNPEGEPYKVLLIDADAQANASVYMLGEYWRREIYPNPERGLYGIYHRILKGSKSPISELDILGFPIAENENYISPVFSSEKKVLPDGKISYIASDLSWPNLHLIPAHYGLINLERDIQVNEEGKIKIPSQGEFYYFELLERFGTFLKQNYDFIIIDCPPNLYSMTENSLYFSDYTLIPVIPDWLSTNGMNWLIMQIYAIGRKYKKKEKEVRGIIPTLWTERETIYARHIRILKKSLEVWKKNDTYKNILKNCEVWDGLQRSASVGKAIESLRPIVDYQFTESSRIQLESMIKEIASWRDK